MRSNLLLAQMEEKVAKVDVSYALDQGVLSKVHGGLRYRELDAVSEAFRSQKTMTRAKTQPYVTTTAPGSFLKSVGVSFPRPFLTTVADQDFILQRSTGGLPLDRNAARDYDLSEKAIAAYVMADFDGELGAWPTPPTSACAPSTPT